MDKKFCPECQKQGLTSNVFVGISTSTALYYEPYYDKEGNYHDENPNLITTEYHCSNGHEWSESV